jgi:class 3 adenylate cyclase
MRVRMGIHTGGAECRDGDCNSPTLNRAARLMSIGYGGQVLVSDAAETLTRNDRRAGAAFANLGKHDDALRADLADLLGEAEQCWAISYARTPRRSRGFASSSRNFAASANTNSDRRRRGTMQRASARKPPRHG